MSDETQTIWAAEEILSAISTSALDAIAVVNGSGEFVHWNPAAERIFGFSAKEIIGRKVHDVLMPERYRKKATRGMEQFSEFGRGAAIGNVVELVGLRKDGTEFPIELALSSIQMDGEWWATAIIRDITERKQAEESLQKAHDELEQRVEERTAELAHEKQTLRQLLESHDRDRQLTAYEIHDGLAQQLVGAQMRLQAFEQLKDENAEKASELLQTSKALLSESISEARQLISGLHPPILDELGIVAAIEYLVHDTHTEEEMEIELSTCLKFERLTPLLENAIFRIVQESLTNARNHSKSDRLRIELVQEDGLIHIEIHDWGIGFDPDSVTTGCFGLQGIQERARLLGGRTTIQSKAGEGTRIAVELPMVRW